MPYFPFFVRGRDFGFCVSFTGRGACVFAVRSSDVFVPYLILVCGTVFACLFLLLAIAFSFFISLPSCNTVPFYIFKLQ